MFLVGFRVQKKCNSKFHIFKRVDISPVSLFINNIIYIFIWKKCNKIIRNIERIKITFSKKSLQHLENTSHKMFPLTALVITHNLNFLCFELGLVFLSPCYSSLFSSESNISQE